MKNVEIIELIPFYKENAVTREYLCRATGLSDRKVRRLIAQARREHPILNMQDGNGYYRPTVMDLLEAKEFLKQEEARAKSIFWSIRGLRKWLKDVS